VRETETGVIAISVSDGHPPCNPSSFARLKDAPRQRDSFQKLHCQDSDPVILPSLTPSCHFSVGYSADIRPINKETFFSCGDPWFWICRQVNYFVDI